LAFFVTTPWELEKFDWKLDTTPWELEPMEWKIDNFDWEVLQW
jgi:hypothetical protein